MTQEFISHRIHTTRFPELQKVPIEQGEYICLDADKQRSFKIVDNDGLVYLLIEVKKDYIYDTDRIEELHGCFIKRFVVEQVFLDTALFNEYINDFKQSVEFAMIQSANRTFYARYKYLWARRETGQNCLIANYLDLHLVDTTCDIQIFRSHDFNN